jgi:V8-like Glu-specific endopeptidase
VPEFRDKPTTVYVIGYPLGQTLSISLADNELIDYENVRIGTLPGPEPRRLHYRAPTERGNSGSPVFNSRTMELIGLHHAGGYRPRLNGQPGKYHANEGLWLRPLFNAFRLAKGMNTP